MNIWEIIKQQDGFIIITEEIISSNYTNAFRITKIDEKHNEKWSIPIDESEYSEAFYFVLELPNNEFIAIFKTPKNYVGSLKVKFTV